MLQKIIIRVDGNFDIGLGHIYRGIAIAEMLKDKFVIEFITSSDSTISPIQEAMFDYVFIPNNIELSQEPFWIKEKYTTDTIILLDGYDFNENYQKQIKDFNFKLVYIDDLAKGTQKADLVINHSPSARIEDYKTESYTQLALGVGYAILRPLFLKVAQQIREINSVDTAFVCFGGSDIHDLTYKTTTTLLNISQFKKINIVIGKAYRHNKIFDLQKQHSNIIIYKNLSEQDLLKVMIECNLAIAPASTIIFELLAVKMPIISGYYVDNQELIYSGFLKKNVVHGIGDFLKTTKSELENEILNFLNSGAVVAQIQNQAKLFGTDIRLKYIQLINSL